MASVKITLHRVPIFELLYVPTGDVHNLVERTTNSVHIATLRETPTGTGAMLASIGKDIRVAPGRSVTGIVDSTDEAALWVQQGTGVYGPTGQRITPRRSRALRWPDRRGGAGFVFRDSVAGQTANPFMWRGLRRGTLLGTQRWTLNRLI
jgi:hypothetical protein